MTDMKNKKKYPTAEIHSSKVEEAFALYSLPKQPHKIITKEFTYNDFKKISAKIDFSLKEWSGILHISERTLQRYAKDNSEFNFNLIDRILQIDKVIKRGYEVFGSYEKFLLWIRSNPYMLEGRLSLESLASFDGINNLLTQLGRIEHGILA